MAVEGRQTGSGAPQQGRKGKDTLECVADGDRSLMSYAEQF